MQRKEDRWTYANVQRRLRWYFVLLLALLGSILCIGSVMINQWQQVEQADRYLGAAMLSNQIADYSGDRTGARVPQVNVAIVHDLIAESNPSVVELSQRVSMVNAVLESPIPTATRLPQGSAPGQQTVSPTTTSSATPKPLASTPVPTQTRLATSSPIPPTETAALSPTATTTSTPTVSTASPTPSATSTRGQATTAAPSKTPGKLAPTSTRTPTRTPTDSAPPVPSKTPLYTATYLPTGTQTLLPRPTATPIVFPTDTNTPLPVPSNTLTPIPSATPLPTPTQVPQSCSIAINNPAGDGMDLTSNSQTQFEASPTGGTVVQVRFSLFDNDNGIWVLQNKVLTTPAWCTFGGNVAGNCNHWNSSTSPLASGYEVFNSAPKGTYTLSAECSYDGVNFMNLVSRMFHIP